MPSTSQTSSTQPNPSQRSKASILTCSGNDERPKKSKSSKVQSEHTRGTDSSKIQSNRASRSSPPLPDHEETPTRQTYYESKRKTKSTRHSHSLEIPETPQRDIKHREVETEEMEEAGASTGARRQASMSLGYTPSSKVRRPHRQGVSRMHLTRDVKVMPTVESFSPLPTSSPTTSISQTSSEYIPTPGPSQSSFSSRNSSGNAVQALIQDNAEVEATLGRPDTSQGDVLFPDLVIPRYFFWIPWYDDRVKQFIRVLNDTFGRIELTTVEALTVMVDTRDAVEFQRLRNQINTSYQQLSFILDRYNALVRAGHIHKDNSFLRRARSIWHDCFNWLARTDRASIGPGTFLTSGNNSSKTQRNQWEDKVKALKNGSQTSAKSKYVKQSAASRADGTSASNNENQEKVPHRSSYYPVRKGLAQQNSLSKSQQGIEIQIPRRNPNDESSNNRWIQTQAEWDRRNRREVTAARIGGSYNSKPPPTPAAEPIASDRLMSSIPPDEFYGSPLDATLGALDKPKYSSQISRESHSSPRDGKVKNSDCASGNAANPKKSLASSSLSHLSIQSQPSPFVASTEKCSKENESKRGKRKRRMSVNSQGSSDHRKKRTRSASHGHKGCSISSGKDCPVSKATMPPLERSSERKDQSIVPSNDSCRFEDGKSLKPSVSSGCTQTAGFDANPGDVGQSSALDKSNRNSRCRVHSEPQPPESFIASEDLSVDTTPGIRDRPKKRRRNQPFATPTPPQKRTREAASSHTRSSRQASTHTIDDSSDSTSSEESVNQTPASDARSRKRTTDQRRRKASHVRPEPSHHDTNNHIPLEEIQPSVTPAPGPSKQSKGKGRALIHDAGENEGSYSGGADDRGQEALRHISPNIQRSGGQAQSVPSGYHISRLIGRDTPWLENTVERKVKEILEKQSMPPPPPPKPLGPRPHNYDPGHVPEKEQFSDEQIVAIIKNKSLSKVVRFALARQVFSQTGSLRAEYHDRIRGMLDEEDWRRVEPPKKTRARPPQVGI